MQPTQRRLRRVWGRALAACALYFLVALVIPRAIRGVRAQRERPGRDEAPEYVMPSGERRRAVVFTRGDPAPGVDRSGDRALLVWSGFLAAVTLAGAVAQTTRIRSDSKRSLE